MALKWDDIKKKSILRFNQSERYEIDFGNKGIIPVNGSQLHIMIRNHRQNVGRQNIMLKVEGAFAHGDFILDENNQQIDYEQYLPEDYEKM